MSTTHILIATTGSEPRGLEEGEMEDEDLYGEQQQQPEQEQQASPSPQYTDNKRDQQPAPPQPQQRTQPPPQPQPQQGPNQYQITQLQRLQQYQQHPPQPTTQRETELAAIQKWLDTVDMTESGNVFRVAVVMGMLECGLVPGGSYWSAPEIT